MAKETKLKKITNLKDEDYTVGAYVVLGIIVLLIAGVFLFIFNVFPLKSSNVVNCTSEKCFDRQFSLCKPTAWTASAPSESIDIYYKITGKVGNQCGIQFSESSSKNVVIACNLDNSGTFSHAQTLAENNPSKYKCRKL